MVANPTLPGLNDLRFPKIFVSSKTFDEKSPAASDPIIEAMMLLSATTWLLEKNKAVSPPSMLPEKSQRKKFIGMLATKVKRTKSYFITQKKKPGRRATGQRNGNTSLVLSRTNGLMLVKKHGRKNSRIPQRLTT